MKTKRIISLLLAFMLVFTVGFALASCGGGNETCTHEDTNTDGKCDKCSEVIGECTHADENSDGKCDKCSADVSAPSGEGVALVTGGNANFQVVVTTDAKTAANSLINDFVTKVNKLVENEVTRVDDKANNVQDVEIIIGTAKNRGDDYKIDEHYLGHKGYAVKVIGNKVVVLAGAADMYKDAMEYLTEDLFGIKKSTKKITDLTVTEEQSYEKIYSNYTVESVKIAGNDMNDYVFAVDTNASYDMDDSLKPATLAQDLQTLLYYNTGMWLEIVDIDNLKEDQKAVVFSIVDEGCAEGYRYYIAENGNLIFESEFPADFKEHTLNFFSTEIIGSKKANVSIKADTAKTVDVRNLYYSEFGAVGDGTTDDFAAIKACHEKANKWGHIVHGDAGKTYYIGGVSTKGESITVMTDTYWHGANFIFDDSEILVHSDDGCLDCLARNAPIFYVKSDYRSTNITSYFEGLSLNGGWGEEDNTVKFENWPLDYLALVDIYDSTRKIFIRYGANEDGGDAQREIILVHPDGTVDPSTPISFDYSKITYASAYHADDTPITIDAGGGTLTNIANRPPDNSYIAFARNIYVRRSNTTICNFDHVLKDEQKTRSPYAGILSVSTCNNVTFENILLQQHKARYELKNGDWVGAGTYEIGGTAANNLKYINCNIKNFYGTGDPENCKDGDFETPYAPGEVSYRGAMGTNYCRNFYFKDCMLTSFDAHKGLGNLTIENCTFEHINLIGSGTAIIRDSVIMADGGNSVIVLREDYGATYRGDIVIENVEMRYCKLLDYNELCVIDTKEYRPLQHFTSVYDEDTGSFVGDTTNYLPVNVSITNLSVTKYTYTNVTANFEPIIDSEEASNRPVYLFNTSIYGYKDDDISKLENGRVNRYIGTERLTITNCQANIILPTTPQFKNMIYIKDGQTIPYPFDED